MDFEKRRDRLRRLVRRSGANAMLVTNVHNVTYLTGFTGDSSYLLVSRDNDVILSDPRYTQQIEEECPGLAAEIRPPSGTLLKLLVKVLGQMSVSTLAFEADTLTVAMHQQLGSALKERVLLPTNGMVESLREIKDREEIGCLRTAIEVAERAFHVIRAGLRPDQSERQVAHQLEQQIRLFGGTGCSFPPIVAVGPRAALPHAVPTEQRVESSDFVLIDWGATARLYRSDLTRILVTGKISPKLERIYGVVLSAQLKAIAAIRPGVSMKEVDAAARSTIAEAGYGKRFGHGLGHGIGLEIHEAPRLAANQDRPLQPGMVVTVEPGIYLPQWGGVRIEDDVLVTRDGHEVLTSVTKQLAECVVS